MANETPTPPHLRPEDDPSNANPEAHEGATEEQVSDRRGPGAGYDQEPETVKNKSGTAT